MELLLTQCMGPGFQMYGARVPNVWGQGSKCMGPGFQMYGARVPNVWGQGSKYMGPGFQMYGARSVVGPSLGI